MKRYNMVKLLAACAVLVGSVGVLSQAKATHESQYKVEIDCHGTNGLPKWADTPNTVHIEFQIGAQGNWIVAKPWGGSGYGSAPVPKSLCDSSYEVGGGLGTAMQAGMVTSIRIRNTGSNAFWVDRMKLTETSTGRWWRWGANNSVGYCLSTDRKDGENKFCWNNRAYSSIKFNL